MVEETIKQLEDSFGKMSVTRGKRHTFVGMDFEITEDGKVNIQMKEYIKDCITSFGEHFNGVAATPATTKLFEVNEGENILDEQRRDIFHHIVAKLLFVAKRGRPDIDLTISYLCGRVDKSTEEDCGKLRRLLHYLNGTMEMKRSIWMTNDNGYMQLMEHTRT